MIAQPSGEIVILRQMLEQRITTERITLYEEERIRYDDRSS